MKKHSRLTALLLALFLLLSSVIRKETGYRYDNVNNYSSHLPLHRALRQRAGLTLSLGVVTALSGAADMFLRRLTETVEYGTAGGTVEIAVQPEYGWFQWVVFAICLLWIAQSSSFGEILGTEVERRYSLD